MTERLQESFEGSDFQPTHPNKPHFECDLCSKGVNYSSKPTVSTYIADDVLNDYHPTWKWAKAERGDEDLFVPLATYCPECSNRRLMFPCKGFHELRIRFDLDADRVMRNVEITDESPADDGIPWNPKELSKKITGVSFESGALIADGNHLWGPENIITFFLAVSNLDIRDLVKWDGTIDPKTLGKARKQFENFNREMANGRKSFRDHMKDR